MDYVIDGRTDPQGRETDRRAKQYMKKHGVGYSDALRRVVRESRNYSAENGPWILPNEANPPAGISEAYAAVGNIVTTAGHDDEEAAQRVNAIFDGTTLFRAAQFRIERRKNQIVGNLSPGMTDTNVSAAYRQALAELPATAAIYNGAGRATMSAAAVREMFNVKYSKRTATHIYSDGNGQEYRVY